MARPNKRIEAVLFDLDDTLIDWSKKTVHGLDVSRQHIGNVYHYLQAGGYTLPSEDSFFAEFRQTAIQSWGEAKKIWAGVNFGKVLQETFATCGLNPKQINLDEALKAYNWMPVPGIEPYEDTLMVLNTLRQQQYKIGLITNSMQPMWMRDVELTAYGILDFLDARVTSGDTGFMKPHPFIYWSTLDMLETAPRKAVFVGDRPANDIAGANKAGLVSVWIDPPHLKYELNGVQPHFRITQLGQLLPILEKLERETN
ncbi:MAG: HAD family hydrolase [Chloroflexi bacterium]|nr:HAD family hydrolase [Chloroflexota bacterium]